MLHSWSAPNLQPESDHCCSMLLLFREAIGSNIRFVINYQWTFQLIIDNAIDLFTSEDQYFLCKVLILLTEKVLITEWLTWDFWQFLEPWHQWWYEYKGFIPSCTDNIYMSQKRWGDCLVKWLIMLGFVGLGRLRVCQSLKLVLFECYV